MKNCLELFSGTHSWGKELSKDYNVISLDRDLNADCILKSGYTSKTHIKEDIMTWDYKVYPRDYFYLITASPVCSWWSNLRNSWIGRKLKGMDRPLTKEDIQNDINIHGKPMVDKVIEIIEYFSDVYYVIENPFTSKMKHYIQEQYPQYDNRNVFSYCKYADWDYEKKTLFFSNINGLDPKICKKDCNSINNEKQHKVVLANGYEMINGIKTLCNTKELRDKYRKQLKDNKLNKLIITPKGESSLYHRYRIPPKLIQHFISKLQ